MAYRETRIKAFDAEKRAQMLHMEANRLIEFAETQFFTQGTKDNETGQRSLQPIKVQRIAPNGENVDIEELFYTNVKRNVQASQYLEDSVFESVQHAATKPTLTNETSTRSTLKKTKRRKKKKRHRTKSKPSSVETSSWHEVALTPRRRPSLGEFQNTFDRWHEVPSKRQPSLEDFQDAFDQFYSDDDFSSVKEIVVQDKRRQPQIREPVSQSPMQDMESVFSAETDRLVSAREGVSDPSMDKMIFSASIPKQKVKLRKVEYDKSDQYITPYEGVLFNQGSSYKEDKETCSKSLAGLSSPNSTPDSGSWKILQNPLGKKKKSKSGKQKKAKPKEDAVDSAKSSTKEHKTKPTSSADNKKDLSSPGKDSNKSKKVSKMKKDKKSKDASYKGEPSVTVTPSATSSLGLSPSSASSKERTAEKKMTSLADGKPGWMSVLRTPPKTPTPPVKIPSTTPQPVPLTTQQKSPSAHLATASLGLSPSSASSKERAAEKKMTSLADGKPGWMSVLRTPPKTPTPPVKIPSTTPQPVPLTTQQKSPSAHLATASLGLSPSSASSKERAAEKKMTSVAERKKPGWVSVLPTPSKTSTPPLKISTTTTQPIKTVQKSPSASLATEAGKQDFSKLMEAVKIKIKEDKPIESTEKMTLQHATSDKKPKPGLPELDRTQDGQPSHTLINSTEVLKQKSFEDISLAKRPSKDRISAEHKKLQNESSGHGVIEQKKPEKPHTPWYRLPDRGVLPKKGKSQEKVKEPEKPIKSAPSEKLQCLPHKRSMFEKRPLTSKPPKGTEKGIDVSLTATERSKVPAKVTAMNSKPGAAIKEVAKITEATHKELGKEKQVNQPKDPEKVIKDIQSKQEKPTNETEKFKDISQTKEPAKELEKGIKVPPSETPSEKLQSLSAQNMLKKGPLTLLAECKEKDVLLKQTELSKEKQKGVEVNKPIPQEPSKEPKKAAEGTPGLAPVKEPEVLKKSERFKEPVKEPQRVAEANKLPKLEPETKTTGWMSGWLTKPSAVTPKQDKKDVRIDDGKDTKAKGKPSGSGMFQKHPKQTKLGEKLDIICKPASLEKPKPADLFSKSPSSKAVIKTEEAKEKQKIASEVPKVADVVIAIATKLEPTENKSTAVTKLGEDIKKPEEKKRSVSPFRKIPSSRETPQAVKETKAVDKPKAGWYDKVWPWSKDKDVGYKNDIPKHVEKEQRKPKDLGKLKIDKSKEAEKVSIPSGEPKPIEKSDGKYETVSYELALTMVPGQPPRITPIRPPTVTTFSGCISTNRFDENMGGNKKMAPDAVYVNDCKIWSRKD